MYDVVIVGAGRAGTAAALALVQRGIYGSDRLLVLDHQAQAAGWNRPYWCAVAPAAERTLEEFQSLVRENVLTFRPSTTAVGVLHGHTGQAHVVLARHRGGTDELETRFIVIASGSFDRPREAMRIPGTRPAGVITGQQLHIFMDRGWLPGRRILLVARSPFREIIEKRLRECGVAPTAVVTPPEETRATGGPVCGDGEIRRFEGTVVDLVGFPRVERAVVQTSTQNSVSIDCDCVVFCIGRMPNALFLKGSGVCVQPGGGLWVNERGETSLQGIYALGSCVTGESLCPLDPSLARIADSIQEALSQSAKS
ncbi:FAD-dependent oxidoreductase [Kyrpidia sp.]|uniref:FAD-dependent oxidoreductase n=1 Tax=Kyrpidia sp. TaxID=2073077 RepID=UPI00258C41FA|nr:FAD-dependent oxidoreductase [Kyrpidia sp.]MCL6576144.1 NAD(P)/FAD-dependent oxidoreductase [Kyrpidia sp.]